MDVSRALREPGEMIPFQEAVQVLLDRDDFAPSGPARLRGQMTGIGESIAVIGEAAIDGEAVCALCLKPFAVTVTSPFEETFLRKGNLQEHSGTDEEEGVDYFTYDGEDVDLAGAAASALHLNMPMRFVCDGGCKGLCPVCGADRNVEPCACIPDDDNPFAALRSLYPDE